MNLSDSEGMFIDKPTPRSNPSPLLHTSESSKEGRVIFPSIRKMTKNGDKD